MVGRGDREFRRARPRAECIHQIQRRRDRRVFERFSGSAFRSGMSMLTLYVIGPAETCPPGASRRSIAAKGKLRELFGRKG